MATITLKKLRTAKNGMASYKVANTRAHGTIYLDKKMFVGEAPESITVSGENLAELPAEAVAAPAAAASPVADSATI